MSQAAQEVGGAPQMAPEEMAAMVEQIPAQ